MTVEYMTKRFLVAAVCVSVLMGQGTILAQLGTAVATAARTAAPTGPMSAVTKAATLVRSMRAAAEASRGVGTAASSGASRASAVTGYLWTANNSPIQNATVQLRSTVTGNVEMYTKTNAVGEFLFSDMKGGSYVIEYVSSASETAVASAASNAGGVIAVGSPFTVAPGETVATFVRSINNVPMFLPDLASNVAQSAVQTAAQAGVTAVVTPLADTAPSPASQVFP
jgi:hypothetical protein